MPAPTSATILSLLKSNFRYSWGDPNQAAATSGKRNDDNKSINPKSIISNNLKNTNTIMAKTWETFMIAASQQLGLVWMGWHKAALLSATTYAGWGNWSLFNAVPSTINSFMIPLRTQNAVWNSFLNAVESVTKSVFISMNGKCSGVGIWPPILNTPVNNMPLSMTKISFNSDLMFSAKNIEASIKKRMMKPKFKHPWQKKIEPKQPDRAEMAKAWGIMLETTYLQWKSQSLIQNCLAPPQFITVTAVVVASGGPAVGGILV